MLLKQRFHPNKTYLLYLFIFAVAFAVYFATGEGHATYYNYYVRLADAFLHGRLYLLENPSWLNELIPAANNTQFYVVYPPLPAVLLMPLVAVFGISLNQTLISIFFGSLTVVLACVVAKDVAKKDNAQIKKNVGRTHLWGGLLFGFGSLFWWLTSTGSVWLIAQVISAFFTLLAIHEFFNKGRPLLIGLLVGASFWCRLPTILGTIFFAGLIITRQPFKQYKTKIRASLPDLVKLSIGVGIFVIFDMAYNLIRFGTPFDAGYWLIPGILNEPWFKQGLFSLNYIPVNLVPFLTGIPHLTSTAPFIQFPMTGLAIWFTTPAFIYALKSEIKDPITVFSAFSIFAIAAIIFTKGLSGWGFGYRYAMDFYPFLFILTIRAMGTKLHWQHKLLITLGIIVNLIGVVAINKFPNVPVLG
jgi:hypothetical protein